MTIKLKRDIFHRGTRMTHRFGPETEDDPIATRSTFRPDVPTFPDSGSRPFSVKAQGDYRYCEPLSPIVKANGGRKASLNGPAPDAASEMAATPPAGTVKRKR